MDRKSFLASVVAVLAAPFVAWRKRRTYVEEVMALDPEVFVQFDEISMGYEVSGRVEEDGVSIVRPGRLVSIHGLRQGDRHTILWRDGLPPQITRL